MIAEHLLNENVKNEESFTCLTYSANLDFERVYADLTITHILFL